MTKKMIRAITGKYRDGILSIVANFIQKGTFLIVTIILANIFGPKLFGEYVFLKQAFDVLIVFILFGGDKSLIYFSAINKRDGLNKLFGVIRFTILFVALLFIISLFFKDKLLVNYDFSYNSFFLIIFAATLLLNLTLIFIESYFIGVTSLKTYFKSVIISSLVYVPLSYFFGVKLGIIGVFIALFTQYLLQFVFLYVKERHSFSEIGIKDIKKDLKQLYTFSLPIGIGELLVALTAFLTSILLIEYASFEELGIFNVAMRMVMFIVFIPNLLNNVLLSYLTIEIHKEKFLVKTVILNLVLSGSVGFIFYVFSNQIFTLFGWGIKESLNDVFIYLIFAILPFCSSLVLLQYLISIEQRWSYLFFRFLREGLTIAFFGVFIALKYDADALLLSKCFLYSNYITLFLLIIFIVIHYVYKRKKIRVYNSF
jgi:O-antigen/teichoic acid export membrane protein